MVYRRGKRTTVRRYRRRAYAAPARRTTTRRRAPARRSAKTPCKCPTDLSPGTKWALAQLDPFDPNALGAKIPDSNTFPSIANSDCDIVSLPALGATFLPGIAFRPQYTWGSVTATSTVANTANWGAAYNGTNRTKRTEYNTAIELTRPCAHAVRMSSPIAPTSATGFVHIALVAETIFNEASWGYPTTVNEIAGCQHYKRVTLASLTQSPLTCINKWIDDTGFRYSSPASSQVNSGAASFQSDYGWSAIVVLVEGGPTTGTLLSFEHLLLSEGIPQKNGVIIGTQAAPNSPAVLSAVGDMTTEQTPFHTEAEQDSYIARGAQAIAEGAAHAGEAAFQAVGVPLLQRLGQRAVGVAASMAVAAMTGTGGLPGINSNPNRLSLMS